MLKLWKNTSSASSHEDLFVQRYERLLSWALQLTSGDRAAAEDLVHNAFIQFTFTSPNLSTIQNLDGYLYGVLRVLHLSQIRRATRSRLQQLSIVDYDSAETGLRVIGPRQQIEIQDELRRICQYACIRKESSKAGSVLILRFFHGYYPSEIVRVLHSSRKVADMRLQASRREAKRYLDDPARLGFLKENPIPEAFTGRLARTTEELLSDLRRTIFHSRQGECFSTEQLRDLYQSAESEVVDARTLAHIVSCATCLDLVNTLLGLPLLATRYPTDTLGKDTRPRGGPTGGGSGGTAPPGGGGSASGSVDECKRRAREVFEHRPQELHFAVNGYVQASQRINAELNEQTLDLNQGDDIEFIEVFSEQETRLLLFTVDDPPPPTGPYNQSRRVEFSDGRLLMATLSFGSPWPTLHVVYQDPLLKADDAVGTEMEKEDLPLESKAETKRRSRRLPPNLEPKRLVRAATHFIGNWSFWLRPSTVTAIVATALIATLLFFGIRKPAPPPLSAAQVLDQAVAQEEMIAASTDTVLHRRIQFEEKSAVGVLMSRRMIEVWHSAERGITARRLYDEKNALVAGDWRRRDGVQTIYHHGVRPQLQLTPQEKAGVSIKFESAWQWSPSAKDFSALVGPSDRTRVEEGASSYVISYSGENAGGERGLLRATLVLSRPDLLATEQVLVIQQGSEIREYRLTEQSFERRPASAVAPSVFEPEPELLSERMKDEGGRMKDNAKTSSSLPIPPVSPAASADLEVEVLRLLNQAGADLGEQISVTRSSGGQLQVEGVVDTDERKREIVLALESVRNNPAVKVQINSVSEALQRQPKTAPSSGELTVERNDSTANTTPVDAELRRYFAGKGLSEDQVTTNARRFANRVIDGSSQVLQRAWALKRLAERFSPDELRNLSPEARTNWLSMIREHARSLQQENAELRQELQPVFFPASSSDDIEEGIEIKDERDLVRAAERLLGICTSNHKLLSAAFTISSDSADAPAIRVPQFRRSLGSAEKLSAIIQSATQRFKS